MRGSLVGVVLLGCWSVALAGTNMRSRIAVPTTRLRMTTRLRPTTGIFFGFVQRELRLRPHVDERVDAARLVAPRQRHMAEIITVSTMHSQGMRRQEGMCHYGPSNDCTVTRQAG